MYLLEKSINKRGGCPPVPQNLVRKMGKNRAYECMIKFERTESQ